jgi:hypothetical protein
MNLPKQTASVIRSGMVRSIESGINPSACDYWCIARCAGWSALKCLYCLTNWVCWLSCGGYSAYQCAKECC